MAYDAWKTAASPGPGHGKGRVEHHAMRCADCTWQQAGPYMGPVFTGAVAHYQQTGHALTLRGVRQDLTKFRDEAA